MMWTCFLCSCKWCIWCRSFQKLKEFSKKHHFRLLWNEQSSFNEKHANKFSLFQFVQCLYKYDKFILAPFQCGLAVAITLRKFFTIIKNKLQTSSNQILETQKSLWILKLFNIFQRVGQANSNFIKYLFTVVKHLISLIISQFSFYDFSTQSSKVPMFAFFFMLWKSDP